MGKIVFHNSMYDINDGLINAYKKYVGEITEESLEYLWKYHSVFEVNNVRNELPMLMGIEIHNRMLLWKNGFGGIIEYGPNGEIRNIFRSVEEMLSVVYSASSIYGFEFYDGQKEALTRNGIVFFGVKFKPLFDQMSWKNISVIFLNIAMRFLRRWINSRSIKSYEDPFFKTRIGDISFDDFCEQYKKNYIFTLVEWLPSAELKLSIAERVEMDEKPYKVGLEKILNRYSVDGATLFEKVSDLNTYTGCAGIYILCLDEIRGYYVGQTSKDIKSRIKSHWSEPSNTFDRMYGPNDISAIYVLRVSSKYLNRVEQDCIANIELAYLLNGFVGGNVIAGIHSTQYKSSDYKMNKDELSEVLMYLSNQK